MFNSMISNGEVVTVRYSLRSIQNGSIASGHPGMQFAQVRLSHSSDLICRYSGEIIQQTPSTQSADYLLPFDLRQLNTPPFLSKSLLLRFFSSFNLPDTLSNAIFDKISAFATRLSAGNLDLNFHILASVDFVIPIWIDDHTVLNFIDDDSDLPASIGNAASPSAIQRFVMDRKFEGELEQLGDCSVCSDELIIMMNEEYADGKELSRIPCGHVFHQSCIVHWLQINNSCPLCRAKLPTS